MFCKVFRVTHPFHPWFGQKFELLAARRNWGEDRVFFVGSDGRMQSMPAAWTDVGPGDPFVVLANGRCLFKPADLLALRQLIDALAQDGRRGVK
ncbi:MAG: DUF5372 family protein [Bacillota bacterium]